MRISKPYRFVFISTPKAGTHSIYKILEDHYAEGLQKQGFHSTSIPRGCRSYFRWTLCRNPYHRAVSLWWSACRLAHLDQYRFREGCGAIDDFTRFIVWLAGSTEKQRRKQPLMLNQTQWLEKVEPITALQMEHLEEEVKGLPFWKPNITIPKLNTTTQKILDQQEREGHIILRPSMEQLYGDPEAQQAVLKWASPDFERFGYSRELG